MKSATAIKKFMNTTGYNSEMLYPECKAQEVLEFKKVCTPEEWKEYGKQACAALNEPFEE